MTCQLRDPCLEFILVNDDTWTAYGVWGAITEGERREFREWFSINFAGEEVPPAPKLWVILGKFWTDYHGFGSEPNRNRGSGRQDEVI
jgi:hypothetical protein